MKWLPNMRSGHLKAESLSEYLDGRLVGRALLRVEAHLNECETCRQEVESLRATVTLLRRAPQPAPRRSFVLMQPPVPAPAPARPRRAFAPAWAFSAAATVLVAVFVTVLSLDVGGALAPASHVPVPSPAAETLKMQAPTSQPGGPAFGIAAVPGPTPSPAPPQLAAPQPTPAPDRGILAGAAEKAATPPEKTETSAPAPSDASQSIASIPPVPTRVLSEEPMAPGRTYSQEPILGGGFISATDTATPSAAPGPAAASPEATTVQPLAQGPTPWGWRVAEGLLAAGVVLLASLGLRLWAGARSSAR